MITRTRCSSPTSVPMGWLRIPATARSSSTRYVRTHLDRPYTPLYPLIPPYTPLHPLPPFASPYTPAHTHTPPYPLPAYSPLPPLPTYTRAAPSPTISPAVRCGRRRRAPRAPRSPAPRPRRTHRTPRRRLRTARAWWRARCSGRRRHRPSARTVARTTQVSSEARRGAAPSWRAWTACARRRPPGPDPSAGVASRAAKRATPRIIAQAGDGRTLMGLGADDGRANV